MWFLLFVCYLLSFLCVLETKLSKKTHKLDLLENRRGSFLDYKSSKREEEEK